MPYPQRVELRFIEVPLSFKLYLNPQKQRFYGLIGLNNQFNLATEKSEYINLYIDYNTYSIGAKVGDGIEYKTNSKIAIQLFSNYNKGLSNNFRDSDYKLNYLSIGSGIAIEI